MGRDQWLIVGAFATTYFVWGATYLANYWAIDSLPPFGMGGTRFLSAGLLMYAYSLIRGDRRRPSLKQWGNSGLIGVLFLSVGTGAVVWAQQFIPTSMAALIISFEPLVVMLMMWGFLSSRPPGRAFLGAAVSILGMSLLIGQPDNLTSEDAPIGLLAIATGMLCWGAGMLLRPKLDLGNNPVRATAMQMIVGGILMLIFSISIDEWSGWSFAQLTTKTIGSWLFLVFFGSILAFSAFNFLLSKVSADKVATNTYVNPVVAVLLGALFNNEVVTGQSMLAGAILLTGVWFINTAKKTAV
ncbi:EamA family transporter [Lewinella sp. W8]|uniref:EamA family transporter n=1 Tax=Lewinella sp. W8 TaxID=2528208 RepID=UPI0010686CE1|nr:EamA family transporter [Lewinella sp. W8]MTB52868.1 EamA family transporter [Lewinella sp. W8]